jgi:hypothetical protein
LAATFLLLVAGVLVTAPGLMTRERFGSDEARPSGITTTAQGGDDGPASGRRTDGDDGGHTVTTKRRDHDDDDECVNGRQHVDNRLNDDDEAENEEAENED